MSPIPEMIEHATRFAEMGIEVFPLARMSKLPIPNTSWLDLMTRDPAKIQKWLGSGDLNYAIHPGAGFLVVDVDVKEGKPGAESYAQLDRELGWPETFEQSTPTGGRHLVYSTPTPVGNPTGIFPGIDIRGWHGYVVGAGSKVPAGEYQIAKGLPIAEAPAWLLGVLKAKKTTPAQKHPPATGESTPGAEARCRAFLATLPVSTEGNRNADAYAAACGCRDRGANAILTRDVMATDWKHEGEFDFGELEDVVLHAFTYAQSAPGVKDPTRIFTPTPGPVQTPPTPSPEVPEDPPAGSPADPDPAPLGPMERYNQRCCVSGGHIWVLAPDEHGAQVWRPMTRADFCLHFNNDLAIFDSKKGPEPIWKHWLSWPDRRTADQVIFAPGQKVSATTLNLWRGWTADASGPTDDEGEWAAQAWIDHVTETFCWSDPVLSHQVLGWCAQLVQEPDEKPLWCLVITGAKGLGKNVFTDRLGELFANNYVMASHERYLKSNFNSHLERALLFVLNEARCSGDEQADATLKSIVTDPFMEIERKGVDSYRRRVYARVVIQGNDDWQVKASSDERRYCVLKANTAALERMGRVAYDRFFKRMRLGFKPEHGGRNALLRRLLEYPIHDVEFSRAPETPYLSEQKELSLPHTLQWWLESLKAGKIQGGAFPLGWPDVPVAKAILLKARNDYVNSLGGRVGITMTKLVRDLKRCCPSLDPAQKTQGGRERENAFGIPPLGQARTEWETSMAMSVPWGAQ